MGKSWENKKSWENHGNAGIKGKCKKTMKKHKPTRVLQSREPGKSLKSPDQVHTVHTFKLHEEFARHRNFTPRTRVGMQCKYLIHNITDHCQNTFLYVTQ